jgi:two-component system nitrogen regulation sensor histidine kinase NtrY
LPKPVFRPEDPVDLVRQAVFLQEVAHSDVAFTVDVDLEERSSIRCDRHQLGQAMTNVLKNAVEAVEAKRADAEIDFGGKVAVTITDASTKDADLLSVTVTDNGIGLPSDRERIAEPYVTTREKGTGLGLAIVNRIIADHGGSISLQNRLDGLSGARVRVLLPYPDPEDVSASQLIQLKDTNLPTPTTVEEPTQWP